MSVRKDTKVPKVVIKAQETLNYLLRGNVGLLLIVLCVLDPKARQAGALLQFPTEERVIPNVMLTATVLAAWFLARAYLWYRDKADKTAASRKDAHRKRKRKLAILSTTIWFAVALALFCNWMWVSSHWVTWSTPPSEKDAVVEAQRVFYHPLKPADSFVQELERRGGYVFAADNDPDWLADQLKAEGVTSTKLLVLSSLLLALGSLVVGLTFISALPKVPIVSEDLL